MILAESLQETENPILLNPDCYAEPTPELLNDLFRINQETNPHNNLELSVASIFWDEINQARIANNSEDSTDIRLVQIKPNPRLNQLYKDTYKGLHRVIHWGDHFQIEGQYEAAYNEIKRMHLIDINEVPVNSISLDEAYLQYRLRIQAGELLYKIAVREECEVIRNELATRYANEALSIASKHLLYSEAEYLARLHANLANLRGNPKLASALNSQSKLLKIPDQAPQKLSLASRMRSRLLGIRR